ncbi:MAG: 1,4-dihydroxy-6-naphthoate synthase [Desulfobulbaceae bacterium]|nr:1,4-dihydroxy-6-naphthoate synthase [Desulfobulbaceae bacterium]
MNEPALSIGFSPCPNDTFIFHALVSGRIQTKGFSLSPEILADVETLNEWAIAGRLDVTKLSFHALGHVLDEYELLSTGAALGRGCGPLLVSQPDVTPNTLSQQTIAVPGRYTTAAMLLKMCHPEYQKTTVMRFDEIMPALAVGKIGAGVIIHESRFTYHHYGLQLVTDLGAWWEQTTGHPIPLGGIAARRTLGKAVIRELQSAIRQSLQTAFRNPSLSSTYVKKHAQEIDDQVIGKHIGLYVNDYSLDLGAEGISAVNEFLRRGYTADIFKTDRQIPTK